VFDSVLPPDRRRYRSQPGGLPTPEMLWSAEATGDVARSVVELYGDELPVELAQHLLAGKPVLIDVAPKLGCVCSGATADTGPAEARARIAALEPPRASSPVIDETITTEATLSLPASPRSAIDVVSPPTQSTASPGANPLTPNESARADAEDGLVGGRAAGSDLPAGALSTGTRRYSPSRGIARPLSGVVPTARDVDGRQLPRTYVARRRFPARGTRSTPADAHEPIPAPREAPSSTAAELLGASAASTLAAPAVESVDEPAPRGASSPLPSHDVDLDARFAERPVALPVTRLSDRRPREAPTPALASDRPVMQMLTLGLLIAVVVLVSAAVGVLVGRWMSQR